MSQATRTDSTRRDVYAIVTEQVITALQSGTVPWHKPWSTEVGLPTNLASGKAYRGINPFLLGCAAAAHGYGRPYWLTFKQAADRGGHVRRGERSSVVIFWKRLEQRRVSDPTTGEEVTERGPGMVLRYYNVFNVEQCEGIAYPTSSAASNDWEPIEACEHIAARYLAGGPSIHYGGDRACYSPRLDAVRMPERERFESAEAFYSTLFHELTHSTGHESRLARRDLLEFHAFGDASYSREELVAEMGAAMLAGVAGIEQETVPQSASYLAGWLRVLRGDVRLVVTAAAQAQKAADLIRGVRHESEEG